LVTLVHVIYTYIYLFADLKKLQYKSIKFNL